MPASTHNRTFGYGNGRSRHNYDYNKSDGLSNSCNDCRYGRSSGRLWFSGLSRFPRRHNRRSSGTHDLVIKKSDG